MENILQKSNKSNTNPSLGHKAEKLFMCDKTFHYQKNLTEHIDVMHKEKKPFRCDICSYRFSKRSVMNTCCISSWWKETIQM